MRAHVALAPKPGLSADVFVFDELPGTAGKQRAELRLNMWRQTVFQTPVAATRRFHAFVFSKKHRQVNTTHEYHDVARVHLTVSDSAAMPPQSLTCSSLSMLDATGHADSSSSPNNHGPIRKKKVRQNT